MEYYQKVMEKVMEFWQVMSVRTLNYIYIYILFLFQIKNYSLNMPVGRLVYDRINILFKQFYMQHQ